MRLVARAPSPAGPATGGVAMDLAAFRTNVQAYRRPTGRAQKELARALGLHPNVLSHKLHGSDGAALTHLEVKGIVRTLAAWQAISTQAEALDLLGLMGLGRSSFPAEEWNAPPLGLLEPGPRHVGRTPSSGPDAMPRGAADAGRRPALPAPMTPLIGRADEVAAVRGLLLGEARLLTLTGVWGTGKTRLALQVAADLDAAGAFADGVALVGLAEADDPALVLPAVARALGLPELAGPPLAARLGGWLRDRRLLLVLDNFEQVLGAAPLVGELLAAAPRLTVLATSRVALRLYGEHEFRVPPLPLPVAATAGEAATPEAVLASEAGRLFVERARAACPGFAVTPETAPAIAEICARLDGLPLAIELAAARTRLFSPPQLLARLERRLTLLTGGARNLPERQQTLRNALNWSHRLLSPAEQRFFARLAVFAGGFGAIAAAACGRDDDPEAVLDGLAALADQGLLERVEAAEPDGGPRFRMLETVREYALARLAEGGEEDAVRRAHAAWCLALAEDAEPALFGGATLLPALHRLEAEHPNLRAALAWASEGGDPATAVRLAGALARFWFLRGHLSEGRARLERALAQPGDVPPGARAKALAGLGLLAAFQHDHARAAPAFDEALAIAEAAGEARTVAGVRLGQAILALGRRDVGLAAARAEASMELFERLGDHGRLASARAIRALAARCHRDFRLAEALLAECLAFARGAGDEFNAALAHEGLALVARDRGDDAGALPHFVAALARYWRVGELWHVALCLEGVAAAGSRGDPEAAARLFGAAEALRAAIAAPVPPNERPAYDHAVAGVRERLEAATFAAAWAAGRAMPLARAVAEAVATAPVASAPAAAPPAEAAPFGLTPRELEILRLFAAGRTDREIAEALFLSRHTVHRHAANIFAKLGVNSRAAAATAALAAGLLGDGPPPAR